MTEDTPPPLSIDPLVKDLNQSVVELRIELDELREKIRRLESEQKMVTAIHKVLAHIDSQPHEPSLKGVLKVLADELEKPL
jgi:thiamine kinase-like enzyme